MGSRFQYSEVLRKSNFQVHNFVQKLRRSANTTVIKWRGYKIAYHKCLIIQNTNFKEIFGVVFFFSVYFFGINIFLFFDLNNSHSLFWGGSRSLIGICGIESVKFRKRLTWPGFLHITNRNLLVLWPWGGESKRFCYWKQCSDHTFWDSQAKEICARDDRRLMYTTSTLCSAKSVNLPQEDE